MTPVYVTRLPGEALEDTCCDTKIRKPRGWMFWGSFYGNTKGPHLVWPKDLDKINSVTYRQYILPLVFDYCDNQHEDLIFMQDGAPGHAAAETVSLIGAKGITLMPWPQFSPDMNPIESIWRRMKDWIMKKYLPGWGYREPPYKELQIAVYEGWEAIGPEVFEKELKTMRKCMKDVIAAHGGHTKW